MRFSKFSLEKVSRKKLTRKHIGEREDVSKEYIFLWAYIRSSYAQHSFYVVSFFIQKDNNFKFNFSFDLVRWEANYYLRKVIS